MTATAKVVTLRRAMELRGARIAVTGATGFLGRYVVDGCSAGGRT